MIDEHYKPRIADFGLAKAIDTQASTMAMSSFNGRGTMRWQAPELLNSGLYDGMISDVSTKSDVYAFACLCLEVRLINICSCYTG